MCWRHRDVGTANLIPVHHALTAVSTVASAANELEALRGDPWIWQNGQPEDLVPTD